MVRALTPTEEYVRSRAGKPYRPANGFDGAEFYEDWCCNCARDRTGCDIFCRSVACGIADPEYPPEWVHDADGWPMCTAFEEPPDGRSGHDG